MKNLKEHFLSKILALISLLLLHSCDPTGRYSKIIINETDKDLLIITQPQYDPFATYSCSE